MAAHALILEKKNAIDFDTWLFLDDDVVLELSPQASVKAPRLFREILDEDTSGFQYLFGFIAHQDETIPSMAMGFGAPKSYKQASGFMSTSNVDANLQGLRRSVVPYLIPFATLPRGFNEAYSQMVLNCLVQTCWPQSMAIVPFVRRKNEAHRRQKSDRMTFDGVDTIIKSQYTTKNFSACPHIASAAGLRQLSDVTKSYDSVVELDKHIPTHAADDCSFLVRRFEAWREKVLSKSPVGVV